MSDATNPDPGVTDAFLSGQGIPVALGEVEAELARLWGPSAERAGGPDLDGPSVTRVSLANLVVAAFGPDAPRIAPVLETVVARRPCRAIVLRRGEHPERRVEAEVSAVCHLPAPGLPQVCSERITLLAGTEPEALDLLPATVFSLLEADLPMVLWWAGDPRPEADLFRRLAAEASRLIPDLDDPTADPEAVRFALDEEVSPYARDLAWFGVSRWRELVAQFFDPPGASEALRRIRRVEVEAVVPAGSAGLIPRGSAWLSAWLAGQLGWNLTSRRERDDGIEADFDGPAGRVEVLLKATADPSASLPGVLRVALQAPGGDDHEVESFALSRIARTDDVRIEVCSASRCALPRIVQAPELDPACRVAAALESSRDDPPYQAALPHLLRLLGA